MTDLPQHPLRKILENRIAIIDGAMGTTIRTYGMKEADIRGERFRDAGKDLLNNGDLFSLTQAKMIGDIHRRFLEAGADIIETNTFGATSISQSEFFVDDPREHGGRKDPEFYQKIIDDKFLGDLAWEINEQSARQCRECADRVGTATGRQRFVAGAIGPLTVSLSNSPDADDPGFRVITFDQVKTAYKQEVRALIAGGSDLLLVETIFDSLNAKAALVAIREVFDEDGLTAKKAELPIMMNTPACCVNGRDPDSRSGLKSAACSSLVSTSMATDPWGSMSCNLSPVTCNPLDSARGCWPSNAFAIAAMCSGVFPQQPPAMLISPPRANSPRYRAMSPGCRSNPVADSGFGKPAFG